MPNSQEYQCTQLAQVTIVQELQSFVNVLGNPMVRLHIEAIDVVLEASGIFENEQFNVRASRPIGISLLVDTIESQSKANGHALGEQPNRNVFV